MFVCICLWVVCSWAEEPADTADVSGEQARPVARDQIFQSLDALQTSNETRDFSERFLVLVKEEISASAYGDRTKEQCYSVINTLSETGAYERRGADKGNRAVFVGLQGAVESALVRMLKEKELAECVGVMYVPRPPTPLCYNVKGSLDSGDNASIADPALVKDKERSKTIELRARIVREYLDEGGRLYTVYPRKGLALRSSEQQETFLNLCKAYPESLYKHEIDDAEFVSATVGATYKFRCFKCNAVLFSIQSQQALDPKEDASWKLWFGPMQDNSSLEERWKTFTEAARLKG
ncbi:MAG TPA: hypothetical protein DIU37_06160 [Opitutae bacterium]|nr:hypothetical protein [Opitutae bacterium]